MMYVLSVIISVIVVSAVNIVSVNISVIIVSAVIVMQNWTIITELYQIILCGKMVALAPIPWTAPATWAAICLSQTGEGDLALKNWVTWSHNDLFVQPILPLFSIGLAAFCEPLCCPHVLDFACNCRCCARRPDIPSFVYNPLQLFQLQSWNQQVIECQTSSGWDASYQPRRVIRALQHWILAKLQVHASTHMLTAPAHVSSHLRMLLLYPLEAKHDCLTIAKSVWTVDTQCTGS